jgi:hypothetical protein
MPILKFSLDGSTFVFLPDNNLELSLELNKFRGMKWSAKDGFGQELGTKFTTMKGRLVYDFKTELPKNAGLTPSGTGTLSFKNGEWAFTSTESGTPKTPTLTPGTSSLSGSSLSLLPLSGGPLRARTSSLLPPPHVHRLLGGTLWVPNKGYTWLDGTTEFRADEKTLAVRWCPGQPSLLPAHVRAATKEGYWEPDPGYQWENGKDSLPTLEALVKSVQWAPGRQHPHEKGLVASSTEGKWLPAAGYVWATDDPANLSVRTATPR